MDEIATSLDKYLAKFNESVTHSAPKKLSFEQLSDSLNESNAAHKKRRLSNSLENNSLNGSANMSGISLNSCSAPPPSPWESRRMKADLIEAKARITKLKQQIDQQNKLRVEMETLNNNKVDALKQQCDYSSKKITDLEKHLQMLRKREQFAKKETLHAQTELAKQKIHYDDVIRQLHRIKTQLEDEAAIVQSTRANELSEFRRHTDKVEMELDLASDELENLRKQLSDYKNRTAAYEELKVNYEKEQQKLEYANSQIKELQYEIASYADWKEITEHSQSRLSSIPDMAKEIERLKANNKQLHDLLGNKLLLEEQVHDYKTRLEKDEAARAEAITLQVKLSHVEQELKEWIKIAQDHCLPNTLVSPMSLRSRIEQLLQQDIIMADEKSTTLSDTKSKDSAMLDLKQKCDIYVKNIEDLNIALKRHKNFKERVQKKLFVVSKERDCYKLLLDNFEKDLTISNATSTEINVDAQIRYRMEMLERTLTGYKEMCAALEKELQTTRPMENSNEPMTEGYDHMKKELDTLRLENEKLRRRKEELELELEHRCLKGDFNIGMSKIVHLSNNPAAEAYENSKNFIEKLQAEIERLKRRNKKLEDDNEVTQTRLNETTNMTMNIKELNQLRVELESTNSKMKKLKECYKSASMEFRDVCYMLFGYRIDRVGGNSNYKLSSMYAESPNDYLNFRLDDGIMELLETPYSETLKPFIETQLVANKSLPTFLSALTLDLFQHSTTTMPYIPAK